MPAENRQRACSPRKLGLTLVTVSSPDGLSGSRSLVCTSCLVIALLGKTRLQLSLLVSTPVLRALSLLTMLQTIPTLALVANSVSALLVKQLV